MASGERTSCLSDNDLGALAEETLPPSAARDAWAHLASCDECAVLFHQLMNHAWADLSTQPFELRVAADPLEGRRTVGRYRIIDAIARGGMGVVYLAFDPELERRVALKVLHPTHRRDELSRSRVLREAQALARLTHPNVTAIYDVGTTGDSLFIAMEFIEGQTLRDWLATPRPWREVVRVFLDAGAGLAAAHQAKLVHRDFKPSNVLIGTDGRARVTDFGIAKEVGQPEAPREQTLSASFTREGMISGTVGYIAPELVSGGDATASSDQFGFCTALYECLVRKRPFAGDTLPAFVEALARPVVFPPEVPRWLAHVVRRGLSRKPDERYESLPVLLDALRAGLSRRRRLLWTTVGVVALLAAVAVGSASLWKTRRTCLEGIGALEVDWQALRQSSAGDATSAAVLADLERKVGQLREERADTCRLANTQPFPARESCLASRRLELEAALAAVTSGELATAALPSALGDPVRCRQATVRHQPLSADAHRVGVAALLERWSTVARDAPRVVSEAARAGDVGSRLRVTLLEADAWRALGRRREAREAAQAVLLEALRRGSDDTALEACVVWAAGCDDERELAEALQLASALHSRLPADLELAQTLTRLEALQARR